MNCVRTSVGKPNDELRGYNGLFDCIGKAAADRISKRVATYCGQEAKSLSVFEEAKAEVINFGRFTDGSNVTEAKLGETFGQWLDSGAVFVFQTKQWLIWNGSVWSADEFRLMNKLAYKFISEAKAALFDAGHHGAKGNLSSFESLNRLENLCKLAATDRAVSLSDFDTWHNAGQLGFSKICNILYLACQQFSLEKPYRSLNSNARGRGTVVVGFRHGLKGS